MVLGRAVPERQRRNTSDVVKFVANIAVCALMISALPLAILGPFRQGHAPTVNVRDEAGIFDSQALRRDLQSLRFRQDIRFEVVSLTGWGINNLDAATANYADNIFDYRQDFRSSGGGRWKEGVVVVAVAPHAHQMAFYPGADVSLERSEQVAIQDAAASRFAAQDWNGGVVAMGRQAETYLGPYGMTVSGIGVVGAGVLCAGGVVRLVIYCRRGLSARRRARAAARSYAQVTYDYDSTALRVGTLEPGSPESRQLAQRYQRFEAEYDDVARAWNRFGEPRGIDWFTKSVQHEALELERRSAALDDGDDVIVDTVSMLTMSPTWEQVWGKLQEPVLENLRSVTRMVRSASRRRSGLHVEAVQNWVGHQNRRLGELTNSLDQGEIAPAAALAELDRISRLVAAVETAVARRRDVVANAAAATSTATAARVQAGRHAVGA